MCSTSLFKALCGSYKNYNKYNFKISKFMVFLIFISNLWVPHPLVYPK
jgi:hypothetical protein